MKKRLLIVSYKIPYPLSQGGAVAQFFFLKKLTTVFNVTFCTIVSNQNQSINLESLKHIIPEITFKVYHGANNNIKRPFAKQVIKYLEKLNRRVKLRLLNIFKENENVPNINRLDSGFGFVNEEFAEFFKNILEGENYNIIQLEFFETISLLPILPEGTKKIFVHHEIRSKKIGLIKSSNLAYRYYIKNIISVIEKSLLNIADSIVVFNQNDKDFLKGVKSNIIVSPFGIPKSLILKKKVSNFFDRFVFVGSEFHFPNKEGLEWFLDTIFVPNQETINWPIYITSNWSKRFKKKYRNNEQIIFTGHLQNLQEVYENAILIAPIISGSGIRTKVLEAFANKIPVMATTFASEGLYDVGVKTKHLLHFESELNFIDQFKKIKNNTDLIIDLADNGFKYFLNNFNENDLFNQRLLVYED